MKTETKKPAYSEEIPTLVIVFVAATITVIILVAALIIANSLRRKVVTKQDFVHIKQKKVSDKREAKFFLKQLN